MSNSENSTMLNGQTPQNAANLVENSKSNASIRLVRLEPGNLQEMKPLDVKQLDANRLDVKKLDEFCSEVQIMQKQLKEWLTKAIHLNGELEQKAALARIVNKSTAELPKRFDEMIERFQSSNAEVLAKSKQDLLGLGEEIRTLQASLAVEGELLKECADERKQQQAKAAGLEEELNALESKLNGSLVQLNDSKQTNDKLNDEIHQSIEENERTHHRLEELNNGLVRLENEKASRRVVLDEKVTRYSELKEKKQALLSGTYVDEKTRNLQMQVDAKRDELKRVQQLIEEIKSHASKPTPQLRLPKLKDELMHSHLRTMLIRLSKLIELNYQHQYMMFEGDQLDGNPAAD